MDKRNTQMNGCECSFINCVGGETEPVIIQYVMIKHQ